MKLEKKFEVITSGAYDNAIEFFCNDTERLRKQVIIFRSLAVALLVAVLVLLVVNMAGAALLGHRPAQFFPPDDISKDTLFPEDYPRAFNEKQDVLLKDLLHTDQDIIPAGTLIDSHMVYFHHGFTDRRGFNTAWHFDGIILGVISDGIMQAFTDSLLGLNTVEYGGYFHHRGMEKNTADKITIINRGHLIYKGNLNTIMRTGRYGDRLRVITQAPGKSVPEPETLFLLGSGLLMMGIFKRKVKPCLN